MRGEWVEETDAFHEQAVIKVFGEDVRHAVQLGSGPDQGVPVGDGMAGGRVNRFEHSWRADVLARFVTARSAST